MLGQVALLGRPGPGPATRLFRQLQTGVCKPVTAAGSPFHSSATTTKQGRRFPAPVAKTKTRSHKKEASEKSTCATRPLSSSGPGASSAVKPKRLTTSEPLPGPTPNDKTRLKSKRVSPQQTGKAPLQSSDVKTSRQQSSSRLDSYDPAVANVTFPKDILPYVPLLPPPRSPKIERQYLHELRVSISMGKPILEVLAVWHVLVDRQATDVATPDDFMSISDYVEHFLKGSRRELEDIVCTRPETFGLLRNMVIEAAAHNHWRGLNELLLKLIQFNRPTDVQHIWLSWNKRIRQVQGHNLKDLNHLNRATRLRARISGPGAKELTLPYMAALTMLDQFGPTQMPALLGVSFVDDRHWRAMKPLWKHLPRGQFNLRRKIQVNMVDFMTVIKCHHYLAFGAYLAHMLAVRDVGRILETYDSLLSLLTRPAPLLVLVSTWVSAWKGSNRLDCAPVGVQIFAHFASVFASLQRSDLIWKMLHVDLPLCFRVSGVEQLQPYVLAVAMGSLSGTIHAATPKERGRLLAQINHLWDDICRRGGQHDVQTMKIRMDVLINIAPYQQVNAHEYYDSCRKVLQGTRGLQYIVPSYFGYLSVNDPAGTIEFLKTDPDLAGLRDLMSWSRIIKSIIKLKRPYEQRNMLLRLAMKRMPAGMVPEPKTFGMMVGFYLDSANTPIEKWLQIVRQGISPTHFNPEKICMYILQGLLPPGRNDIPPARLELALHVLRHVFPRTSHANPAYYQNSWTLVINCVVTATNLNGSQRHQLIADAVDSLPQLSAKAQRLIYLNIIKGSVQRPDREGLAEALYYWPIFASGATQQGFDEALGYLRKAGFNNTAQDLLNQWEESKADVEGVDKRRLEDAEAVEEAAVEAQEEEMAEESGEDGDYEFND